MTMILDVHCFENETDFQTLTHLSHQWKSKITDHDKNLRRTCLTAQELTQTKVFKPY